MSTTPADRLNPEAAYPYHVELVDGREREKPVPKKLHARIQAYLIIALAKLLPASHETLSELNTLTGATMPDGRREYIVPDVEVARVNALYLEGDLAEPPLLGVEILSPGQTITELFSRANRLVKLGATNVWVIWPEKRRAWEVGPDLIEEKTGSELTLYSSSRRDNLMLNIETTEMWAVLDRDLAG